MAEERNTSLNELYDIPKLILSEVKKVIKGKDDVIKMMLTAIIAKGHVLLEDIPGVGKTTLAMTLRSTMSLSYKRVSFTPDVLPGDILGFSMYDKNTGELKFVQGSVYTNLFLADEINRTSPKTQSALLEVMEEGRATVEGKTFLLPSPFFVIATENPFGSSGTQRLPESQLDRFIVSLTMGYPSHEDAIDILKGDSKRDEVSIREVCTKEDVILLQEAAKGVFTEDSIYEYIIRLTEETRNEKTFSLGLSPRGSISLLKMAKAYAFINKRDFVIPEDVIDVFIPVSSHRVHLSRKANELYRGSVEDSLKDVISNVPYPRTKK